MPCFVSFAHSRTSDQRKPRPFASTAAKMAPSAQAQTFDQTQYKEKSRKIVALVNRLRDAGAHNVSVSLPTLVVCGNQSAGKSSLLESLCAVKLPRAAGTCTKCPTEVRLDTSAPGGSASWCCAVKLRREYGKDNKPLENKPKETLFKTLDQDQKDQLHFSVSAAQRALLNPDTPADIFVRDADKTASEALSKSGSNGSNGSFENVNPSTYQEALLATDALKFTRNVVVLEITGADVNLSLIDLPGIIQTEQGDDGSNVKLVKELVEQYISSDRAIIVATITCKDDIDNQAIVQMARAADKDGSRTIGVLTKADTIEPGTHNNWLKVLQGQHYPLRLGYYCVVNPSQADINDNISREDAAAKEHEFFKRDAFFGSTAVASVRERFGVDALRVQLSKQLVSLTQRELPKMKEALDELLAQAQEQLQKLPPPLTDDPNSEFFNRLRDLAQSVSKAAKGYDNAGFFRAVAQLCADFKQSVLSARPTVRLTSSTSSRRTWRRMQEEDAEFWLEGPEFKGEGEPEGLITLELARQLAAQYRLRELPSFQSYRVLEELVRMLKGRWDAAAIECMRGVGEELQQLTGRLVEEHFGQFAAARTAIREILYSLHDELLAKAEGHISALLEMEGDQIWTQNSHYMVSSKQHFEDLLVKQVYGSEAAVEASSSSDEAKKQAINTALAQLASVGMSVSPQLLDLVVAKERQKTAEEDAGLLQLIAGTLAYLKVSSKRVIDIVPMHLHHYLLKHFCMKLSSLPGQLAAEMLSYQTSDTDDKASGSDDDGDEGGSDSSERGGKQQQKVGGVSGSKQRLDAARLMAEDESTAERRAQLHRQLKQLQGVKMILNVF